MGRRVEDINDYIEESIKNIRNDRALTSTLLTDLLLEMKKTSDLENHKQLGMIASKYVETLQRSNEQIVKLLTLNQKEEKGKYDTSLSEEETNNIFELIQAEGQE